MNRIGNNIRTGIKKFFSNKYCFTFSFIVSVFLFFMACAFIFEYRISASAWEAYFNSSFYEEFLVISLLAGGGSWAGISLVLFLWMLIDRMIYKSLFRKSPAPAAGENISKLVRPDYNIYHFTDGIYKVVHFKSTAPRFVSAEKRTKKGNENKLDAALSRARRTVLELALCNPWKYFCAFTITGEKYNRKDLVEWHEKFTQWLRDQRKKYKKAGHDFKIDFLLVPEQHKDGSWHMHGLFSDISPVLISFEEEWNMGLDVPYKLVKGGFFDWPDYQEKFGFCSFGSIRDKAATSFYITKYITKQLQDTAVGVGLHLYYPSRGLNRAVLHGDIYGHCGPLHKYLTNHYDFCDTGMTHVKDGLSWDFALEYMDYDTMEPFGVSDPKEIPEVDAYFQAVQEVLDGF